MEESKRTIKCRGIIVYDDKLLVLKHRAHAEFYAFPGGHIEKDEIPKECLEREIKEELGVMPIVDKLLYTNTFKGNEGDYFEFFFEIKNGVDFYQKKDFPGFNVEFIDFEWIDKNSKIKILPEKIIQDFRDGIIFSSEVQFLK